MKLELKVMFQDEARFGRISEGKKCWSPRKKRPIVKSQIIREYTYLYGAFSPKNGESEFLILPYMNSQCMSIFLDTISKNNPNKLILMVTDNASCHTSSQLKIPINIKLLPLPPYSPELNPSENMWGEIREKFFHNFTFDSMESLENCVVKACNYYFENKNIIKSVTNFKWIKKIFLKAN